MMKRQRRPLLAELFGGTPCGVLGCILQWFALGIVLADRTSGAGWPAGSRLLLLCGGLAASVLGFVFAHRGKSLGPVIMLAGLTGIVLLLVINVILFPIRYLSNGSARTDSK